MANKFYVYLFLRKDGTPYYTGKGHGQYGRKDLGTGILHNHTDGGDGSAGHTLNEEQRKVRSTIARNQTAEARAKISKALKGRKLSKATLDKMRKSAILRSDTVYRAMMSEAKKNSMTPETRDKISQSLKGKPKSEIHKEHCKEAWTTRPRKETLDTWVVERISQGQQTYWNSAVKLECPHCHKIVVERFYYKWHGNNCKQNVK